MFKLTRYYLASLLMSWLLTTVQSRDLFEGPIEFVPALRISWELIRGTFLKLSHIVDQDVGRTNKDISGNFVYSPISAHLNIITLNDIPMFNLSKYYVKPPGYEPFDPARGCIGPQKMRLPVRELSDGFHDEIYDEFYRVNNMIIINDEASEKELRKHSHHRVLIRKMNQNDKQQLQNITNEFIDRFSQEYHIDDKFKLSKFDAEYLSMIRPGEVIALNSQVIAAQWPVGAKLIKNKHRFRGFNGTKQKVDMISLESVGSPWVEFSKVKSKPGDKCVVHCSNHSVISCHRLKQNNFRIASLIKTQHFELFAIQPIDAGQDALKKVEGVLFGPRSDLEWVLRTVIDMKSDHGINHIIIPKFRTETTIDLNVLLKIKNNTKIPRYIHRSLVDINEFGINTNGLAHKVESKVDAAKQNKCKLKLDRPFIYILSWSGLPVPFLLGRVLNINTRN